MIYNIQYKSTVQKDLKRLPKSEVIKILNQIEDVLSKDAGKFPVLKGEFKVLRKFRVGNYRVIYTLLKSEVSVMRISHRKEVYK